MRQRIFEHPAHFQQRVKEAQAMLEAKPPAESPDSKPPQNAETAPEGTSRAMAEWEKAIAGAPPPDEAPPPSPAAEQVEMTQTGTPEAPQIIESPPEGQTPLPDVPPVPPDPFNDDWDILARDASQLAAKDQIDATVGAIRHIASAGPIADPKRKEQFVAVIRNILGPLASQGKMGEAIDLLQLHQDQINAPLPETLGEADNT